MNHPGLWLAAGLIAAGSLTACRRDHAVRHAEHPVEVQPIEGTNLRLLTLTERAIQRIDLATTELREQKVLWRTSPRKVVPYAAVIYDSQGQTWIYTSPKPRTFVRHKIDVDYIESGLVILKDGPPAGTVVASRAVAQLYGADFGVGH